MRDHSIEATQIYPSLALAEEEPTFFQPDEAIVAQPVISHELAQSDIDEQQFNIERHHWRSSSLHQQQNQISIQEEPNMWQSGSGQNEQHPSFEAPQQWEYQNYRQVSSDGWESDGQLYIL